MSQVANHIQPLVSRPWTVSLIFAASFFVIGLAGKPIVNSNDGSHFALVQAMAINGEFVIDPYVELTKWFDLSKRGDHFYTDRPPGAALLAQPIVRIALTASALLGRDAPRSLLEIAALMPIALCAVLNMILVFALLRALGCRDRGAMLAALVFGFGSLNFRYGTTLFTHVPAATCVLTAFWLVMRLEDRLSPRVPSSLIALGLVSGFAPTVEYVLAPLGPVMFAYLLLRWLASKRRSLAPDEGGKFMPLLLTRGLAFSLAWFAGIAFLLYYNWKCFGHPLHTSYRYHHFFIWARSFSETFNHPRPLAAVQQMMISFPERGLLMTSPIFWLSGAGLAWWWRRGRRALMGLWLTLFLALLILMAHHRTFWGGASYDTRYIFAVTPLLFLAAGVALDSLLRGDEFSLRPPLRGIAMTLLIPAALMSLFWQIHLYVWFPGYVHVFEAAGRPELSVDYALRVVPVFLPKLRFWWIYILPALCVFGMVFAVASGWAGEMMRRLWPAKA